MHAHRRICHGLQHIVKSGEQLEVYGMKAPHNPRVVVGGTFSWKTGRGLADEREVCGFRRGIVPHEGEYGAHEAGGRAAGPRLGSGDRVRGTTEVRLPQVRACARLQIGWELAARRVDVNECCCRIT